MALDHDETEQSEEKDLGKRGDHEPVGHSGFAPEIMCGYGRNL